MRKLPIIILLVALAAYLLPSCNDKKDEPTVDAYQEWYDTNEDWMKEQQARTNPDGSPYFATLIPKWNPNAFVLIHYFNDRKLTEGNLSPLYTSTIDTRYYVTYCNGVPIDSSYNQSSYGPGIFRCQVNGVIDGWAIALEDMRVGDTAEVVIPFQQAYGTSSSSVLPYSNLKYNMSLVDIVDYEKNPY